MVGNNSNQAASCAVDTVGSSTLLDKVLSGFSLFCKTPQGHKCKGGSSWWVKAAWEGGRLLVWELFSRAKRWNVEGRVQVCRCTGQAPLLPKPGPLPSTPPELSNTTTPPLCLRLNLLYMLIANFGYVQ